jgi:N-acetyl-gamma-glutamylphosphate reductase
MNKFNQNNVNKYGLTNHRHNLETLKRHEGHQELIKRIQHIIATNTDVTSIQENITTIINEHEETCPDPPEQIMAEIEHEIDLTAIYNQEEKIPEYTKEPKMKTVVNALMTKVKLDKIIKSKKW